MKSWLLMPSLSVNMILAVRWVKPKTVVMTDDPRMERPSGLQRSNTAQLAASPSEIVDVSVGADQTTWKDIQSDDLKEMIRRLRAIGCPEETIQDIILAEVNRMFAGRFAALWPDRGPRPFWKTTGNDPAEQKKNRERSRQERAIR